jgi:ABC-2 type transport system permease protein
VTALAILGRELRGYFTSVLAYVVLGVFLVLSGYFFYTNLGFFVLMGGMDLPRGLWQYQFHDMRELLLFAVVFLTMRLFAEEKKLGTIELMWTYPVRDGAIVLGKYAAALVMVAVMLGLTATHALVLGAIHHVAAGPLVAGYLGLFLLSAAFAACGLWASSLTDSQLVAGLVSFGILTLFWMLTWNQAAASDWVIALLMPVSLFDRFHTFARGAIDARDVVFLSAFSAFFLFLTYVTLESRRWRGLR